MRLFDVFGLGDKRIIIDWNLTPQNTYSIFESWGGREYVPDSYEMFYYFYIDNNTPPARLLLMERAVKHARILAWLDAPMNLINKCLSEQGYNVRDRNFAINIPLKKWLETHILDGNNLSLVHRLDLVEKEVMFTDDLPGRNDSLPAIEKISLRNTGIIVSADEAPLIVKKHNFYEKRENPGGYFQNYLVNNEDGLTVSDLRTDIMWQREGCGITAIKTMRNKYIKNLNSEKFAENDDWRLPTIEEALSLLEPEKNDRGIHLHPCFSQEQPYIFLSDRRKPGGYWFIDFRQAMIFWASGTIPGGFGRVCRNIQKNQLYK